MVLSFCRSTTGYETCFFKKIIAPEQINVSFAFANMKFQAKQFSAKWNLLLFIPLCLLVIFSISLTAEFY